MRFMVMVKATKDSEAGVLPSEELLTAMGRFNEELAKAGVMLAGDRVEVLGPDGSTIELASGGWSHF